MKSSFDQKAFSLVESLIAMAVLGIIISALSSVYISSKKNQASQDLQAELQQNVRSAADFVVREIRNSNTSPSCIENSSTPCSTGGDKITFTSELDANTRIFSWSGTDNILKFSSSGGSPNRQPLIDHITAFTLTPNNSTLSSITRIDLAITGRTATIDPATRTYRTFTLTTSITRRN